MEDVNISYLAELFVGVSDVLLYPGKSVYKGINLTDHTQVGQGQNVHRHLNRGLQNTSQML